ncbi:MAG: porin [Azospirillum sp.]|nr:porin [Azospirillum sp.]
MKKTLYGTTAIVALGLAIVAAAPASAQAPAQGFSSTNFQFTVGGLARGFVGGVSQTQIGAATAANNAAPAVAAGGNLQSFDIQRDYRLDLTARSTLPNGMVASAVVQIQPNSGPYNGNGGAAATANSGTGIESQFRRNWVALQSAFGEVRIGALDNVTFQMQQRSMDAFTAGSVTNAGKAVNDYTVRPNVFNTDDILNTQLRMYDRSADKIAYFTPRIEGFQLGANYTPEASKDRNSGLATGTGGVLQRGYAFSGNYVNTFGGLGVRASAGYVAWKMPRNNVPGGANGSDPSAWNIGGGVTYMGFDFGGSYAQLDDVMTQPSANPLRLDAAGTAGATGVARFMADARVFELGLGYTMGPARMSLNYFNAETGTIKNANTTTAVTTLTNAGKDKLHGYAVSGAYTMGPGVNLEATVFHVRATGPFTSVNVQNVQKATGLLTGLILTF